MEIKKLEKLQKRLRTKLRERNIFPNGDPVVAIYPNRASYVTIKCIYPYYRREFWFFGCPKNIEDWQMMERFAYIEHLLKECPKPEQCSKSSLIFKD